MDDVKLAVQMLREFRRHIASQIVQSEESEQKEMLFDLDLAVEIVVDEVESMLSLKVPKGQVA